jgi:hypothetical protein
MNDVLARYGTHASDGTHCLHRQTLERRLEGGAWDGSAMADKAELARCV